MCQVHLIKKFEGIINQTDALNFFSLMNFGAISNPDAFGFFNRKRTIKRKGSFNKIKDKEYYELSKNFNNDSFIIGHNRLATTGSEKINFNNHPFRTENFILVHNGIISNHEELKKKFKFDYKEETDSAIIVYLIEHFLKKTKNIIKAIKKTAEKLSGSFSVIVYCKKTGDIYYFKDSETAFSFGLITRKDEKILLGSTKAENIKALYRNKEMIFYFKDFDKRLIIEAEAEKIYKINNEKIEIVDNFKENKISYIQYGRDWSEKDLEDIAEDEAVENFIAEAEQTIGKSIKWEQKKDFLLLKVYDSIDRELLISNFPEMVWEMNTNKPLEAEIENIKQYFGRSPEEDFNYSFKDYQRWTY